MPLVMNITWNTGWKFTLFIHLHQGFFLHRLHILCVFCRILTDTYSKCKENSYRCLVLDKAGFVVMHDDFLSVDITSESLEYVHITEKEKHMAEDLINKRYMVKKQCRNLNQLKLETFFELQLPSQGVNMLDNGQTCRRYQLSPVDGSNIFLGMLTLVSWLL